MARSITSLGTSLQTFVLPLVSQYSTTSAWFVGVTWQPANSITAATADSESFLIGC